MTRVFPEPSSGQNPKTVLKSPKLSRFRALKQWVSAKLPSWAKREELAPKKSSLRLRRSSLGSGGHASVMLGEFGDECEPVAVKILPASDPNTYQELDAFRRLGSSHRNVVAVHPHVPSPHQEHIHLPMELCDESLLVYVERCGGLEEDEAKAIFREVIAGLQFLHDKGVYHLDIKPDNILMKSGVPKLADLGMALNAADARAPANQVRKPAGTSRYASPECVTAKKACELETSTRRRLSHGELVPLWERKAVRRGSESNKSTPFDPEKVDVWALGITMFAEIVGVYPWPTAALDNAWYTKWSDSFTMDPKPDGTSLEALWPSFIGDLSATRKGTPLSGEFMALMRGMLHPDPGARLTLASVRDSPFFRL